MKINKNCKKWKLIKKIKKNYHARHAPEVTFIKLKIFHSERREEEEIKWHEEFMKRTFQTSFLHSSGLETEMQREYPTLHTEIKVKEQHFYCSSTFQSLYSVGFSIMSLVCSWVVLITSVDKRYHNILASLSFWCNLVHRILFPRHRAVTSVSKKTKHWSNLRLSHHCTHQIMRLQRQSIRNHTAKKLYSLI